MKSNKSFIPLALSFLIILMLLFSFAVVCYNGFKKEDKKSDPVVTVVPAWTKGATPDFELVADDGTKLTIADFIGKKVYINVWASGCVPCRKQISDLEEVYQGIKDKGDWIFLLVTSPSDEGMGNSSRNELSKEEILEEIAELGATFPVYFEENHSFLIDFDIRGYPTNIFINSDGTIANYGRGAIDKTILLNTMEQVK